MFITFIVENVFRKRKKKVTLINILVSTSMFMTVTPICILIMTGMFRKIKTINIRSQTRMFMTFMLGLRMSPKSAFSATNQTKVHRNPLWHRPS